MCLAIIWALLSLNADPAQGAVVHSDTFDNAPDWTSNQLLGTDLTWPRTGSATEGGTCTTYCPPAGWTYYGGAKTLWSDDKRKDTFILNSTGARGTGKGMTIWHEGAGTWANGNMLSKYLGAGHPELYARFYLKYDPSWTWTDGSANHGQQKLMRIASYSNGTGKISTTDPMDQYGTAGWNSPVWMPYFYHNSSYGTTKFISGARLGPNYTANGLYENLALQSTDWPTDGQWHSYEFYVKLNSAPGVADGKWAIYIDGALRESRNDMLWVQSVPWKPNTTYAAGLANTITPTTTMRGYKVIKAGTSGTTQPNWLYSCPNIGDTCTDGTVVWQNYSNFNWNHLTFLDNMYTTHDRSRTLEQFMNFDDAVISTTYSGPPPKPATVAAAAGSAGSVKVTWSAGSNGAVYPLNGYRIHYGTDAANLSSTMTVGNVTEATVSNLLAGRTYYFAVTAYNKGSYDSNENVSARSNVVSAATSTSTAPPPATDTVAPVVSISAPADAATVSGTVNVTAAASDNVGVSKVEFYVNGTIYGVTGTAPYSIPWNTTSSANGSKTLTVKAYDAAGNAAQSSRTVNVSNATSDTTAPVIGSFSMPASATSSTVAVSSLSATDNVGVTGYFISESAAAPTATTTGWRTTAPTSFTFAGTGARTAYLWARDAAGNVSTSRSATVSISSSVADATLPTVYLTAPTYGGQLAGTAVFSANASDNVGVTRVEFFVNGVLTGTDTSAPYSYSWNSTTVPNGSYNVSAKAYDAAGNVGVAATKPVTVANSTADTTVPTVGSFSIAAVSRSLTVPVTAFAATDNVAVTGYLISESSAVPAASATGWRTAAPTSFTFAGTGSRTAYAWAKDAAGNVSARRSATVTIDTELPKITSLSVGSGTSVTIKSSATDNLGVTKMQLYVDGTLKHQTTASYFSYVWSVPYRGTHNITVKAYDAAGNVRSVSANVTR